MEEHTYKVLEFHEVKNKIADFSCFELGKDLIVNLKPFEHFDEALIFRQEILSQFIDFFNELGGYNLRGLKVIDPILSRAKLGAVLNGPELIEVLNNLNLSRNLKKYFYCSREKYVLIWNETLELNDFENIENQIKRALTPDGILKNEASPKLARLKKAEKSIRTKIQNNLEKLVRDSQTSKMLQDPVITIRQDRYVLPVKNEYKRKFIGHVVDQSSSGLTIFMEPASILNLGNQLRANLIEEKKEEERILGELSLLIKENVLEILESQKILARLDFYFSIACWSIKWKCNFPKLNKEGYLYLKGARHPLLKNEVVPIDILVGNGFKCLVLTGPNTGGKTVALKTVGILILLAMCGLPVPAESSTSISFFNGVFADIGDEQSIFQNLSTFSAHLNNIIRIIRKAGENSLVLLDEIGAGTDPSEGSAMAMAILDYFSKKNIKVIASTHFNDLKKFASSRGDFENAAVEFDSKTLRPKYSIVMGIPGKSCAFEVASFLGLDPSILEDARLRLDAGEFKVDKLLEDISRQRDVLNREKKKVEDDKFFLDRLAKDYAFEKTQIEIARKKFENERKNQIKDVVDYYERICEKIYEDFKEEKKRIAEEMKDLALKHKTFQSQAEITEKFKETEKKFDKIKSSLGGKDLSVDHEEISKNIMTDKESVFFSGREIPAMEINLRGKTIDEAIYELEKYLDRCILCNMKKIYIVHGKGKGILKKAIWEYLKELDAVKNFRLGNAGEGSWGVTVVEFK